MAVALPGNASLLRFFVTRDGRGGLGALEFQHDLPFAPRRFFMVFDVSAGQVRGMHAHRTCHQFLFPICGSIRVVVDDIHSRAHVQLEERGCGLHIPPMVWAEQSHFSPGAVLGVFASEPFDADEYIRSYEELRSLVNDQ